MKSKKLARRPKARSKPKRANGADAEASKSQEIKCPACMGKGKFLIEPKANRFKIKAAVRRKAAVMLHAAGMPNRKIMKLLGYKSPNSIEHFLRTSARA